MIATSWVPLQVGTLNNDQADKKGSKRGHSLLFVVQQYEDIFLCLPRAERNQRFLFVKNESIKFCCSGGFSNVPDVMEASVLFISTVFHVRSVSCRCLYLGFRAPCAARVTRVTCSKRSLLGVPLELE